MTRSPKIFGHRGAPVAMPENTIEGFQHAIDAGADGLEIDLLMTRDGVPVVTHNPCLSAETTRDANGNWLQDEGPAISALTLEELRSFDVGGIRPGSKHDKKHPNQTTLRNCRIPTLVEFLELVKGHRWDLELLVELKHTPTTTPQISADDFVRIVADTLIQHDLVEQSYLHAFNWQILSSAARNYPQLRRSHLSFSRSIHPEGTVYSGSPWLDGLDPDFAPLPELLAQSGATVWSPHFVDLTSEGLTQAQDQNLQVMTWTVNDETNLRHQLQSGVDGIITDDPKLALSLREEICTPQARVLEGQML